MGPDLTHGERWLAQQPAETRKRLGQWFTPWWVVDRVISTIAPYIRPGDRIVDPACGDGRWLLAVGRRVPGTRLIGMDIDPGALQVAKISAAQEGIPLTLIEGDALSEPGMPEAEWVVGNPPYVRPQNLPRTRRADLWERFSVATDKADLYACFVERMLDRAPQCALVLPENWLHLASFAALRRRILLSGVDAVWSLPDQTFDAAIQTVVLVCGPRDQRAAGALSESGLISTGDLVVTPHAWSLDGPLPMLHGEPLSEYMSVHMGIVCGDYPRYVHYGRRFPADKPTCRGRDVLRWDISDRDEFVRYLPRDMLERKPYVAPKNAELFDVPEKIVLAGASGTLLRAAMDTARRFPLDSCYVLRDRRGVDPWAVLGFLLSPQVSHWYGARHRAVRVKGVEISRIPLPRDGWKDVGEATRARDETGLRDAVERAYHLHL